MSNIYNHQRFPPPKIGAKLQLLRLAENLTLDELSEKSGVSTAILSQIERNKSNPTLSTLWRITQTLDHPLENLLGSNEPANTVEKINNNTKIEVCRTKEKCLKTKSLLTKIKSSGANKLQIPYVCLQLGIL